MTDTEAQTVDMLDFARDIAEILDEKKGEDILVMDLKGLADFTDYFVICTGASIRTVDSMKQEVQTRIKQSYSRIASGIEGDAASGWILMDYGDVILHIFTEPVRSFYQLEDLWSEGRVVLHLR